jgi:hypothetical protein
VGVRAGRKKGGVFLLLLLLSALFSCRASRAGASFRTAPEGLVLYGLSRAAAEGTLDLARPQTLEYRPGKDALGAPFVVPPLSSLEIRYSLPPSLSAAVKDAFYLVLNVNGGAEDPGTSWILPWDASFLGFTDTAAALSYAVPLAERPLEGFAVFLSRADGKAAGREREKNPAAGGGTVRIESAAVVSRRFGFSREGELLSATPFVRGDGRDFVIDPPAEYRGGEAELQASGAEVRVTAGGFRFRGGGTLRVPAAMLAEPFPAGASGAAEGFTVAAVPPRPFPDPVPADPGVVLAYPAEAWRDPRYEVFRWDGFPSILIFDTADYLVQDRLFRRLAFFVEKRGFRGRLLSEAELAGKHGWNAHDYRAEDLARFFDAAEKAAFPLLDEERELGNLLFDTGILRRDASGIVGGEGAVLSVSQESSPSLRELFMVHEGFHGLFFTDGDFRDFSRARWESLSPASKNFMLNYFDYLQYDIEDEYLVINEFMAYCLQQPASRAARYFGDTIASRLAASPRRRGALPPKDEEAGYWPGIARTFAAEAEAFSAYVSARWGFAAGRLAKIQAERPVPAAR